MQTLYVVVDDAHLNMMFNEAQVKRYRLIGFDNRKDVLADSSSILEGGEIGTGHTVTAVFEIELNENYSTEQLVAEADLSFIPVRSEGRVEEKHPIMYNYHSLYKVDSSYRFAAAVAMFGLMLKQSPYIDKPNWDALVNLLNSCVDPTDYWQNEMLLLVKKAKELYKPVKERKRWFRKRDKNKEQIILF